MRIIELEEIDSTNEYCKRMNFQGDVAVFSKVQTAGRGTKGRSFISNEGGLYVTVVRHYENFPACEAFKILVNACVAVCKTLESYSVKPQIRWANDVLAGGKKISGTLIENTFCGDNIVRSVVGTGINFNNEICGGLKDIATSVKLCTGREIDLREAGRRFLYFLGNEYNTDDYRSYIGFIGDVVTVYRGGTEFRATALGICDDGRLKIRREDGKTENLSSAEVGLRI